LEPLQHFNVDIVFYGEDIINTNDKLSGQGFTMPGHTRDALSSYIAEEMLIATESAGCLDRNDHKLSANLLSIMMPVSKHWNSFPALTLRHFAGDTPLCLSTKMLEFSLPGLFQAAEGFKGYVEELFRREGELIDRLVDTIKTEEV
jgi:hypothetical protein